MFGLVKIFSAFILVLGLGFSAGASAADVQIKKGLVSIDAQPVFRYEGPLRIEGSTTMIHSAVSGEPLFTVYHVGHDGWFQLNLKFTGVEGEARRHSTISFKELFEKVHAAGIVTPEGKVDVEKAAEFHRMFGRPIPEGFMLVIF